MQAVAERTQVIELVKTLPDEQVNYILQVIQSLPLVGQVNKVTS